MTAISVALQAMKSACMNAPAGQLTVSFLASIKAAAQTAAYNMMTNYKGNLTGMTPGLLPDPYYWWEAGAMFGQLIHHWHLTGDTTYNDVITQGVLWQIGDTNDFMPQNRTKDLVLPT